MKLRHQDIFINPDNPFEGCKLERKQYADKLTELVKASADGFVLAVDNKWGSGKTTFIKMWKCQMEQFGFKTVYFNAWENDFDANPMSAILAELKSLLPEDKDDNFKPLIKKGTVIVKNLIPSIAKALVSNYIGLKGLEDIAESAIKGGAEILEEEVNNYIKRQKGLSEFTRELEKYINNVTPDKPLIFIVDELDRCRPNYAVEVLENIKHFFSVKGILFVLSIDKVQLSNAIKGFYGTDRLDTEEYLRRFIDLEFSIPEPSTKLFVNYLYNYYDFAPFFESPRRVTNSLLRNEPSGFIKFAILLFEGHNLTLRQQEKLFSHTRIALNTFHLGDAVIPSSFIFLTYIYQFNKTVYFDIKNRKYNLRQFAKNIQGLFPENPYSDNSRLIISTFAMLLYLYNNYYKEINHESEIFQDNGELLIDLNFKVSNATSFLKQCIDMYDREVYKIQITYLLSKIELLENVKY